MAGFFAGVALAAGFAALALTSCGDDDTTGGSSGSGGAGGEAGVSPVGGDPNSACRFERPLCAGCISQKCGREADDCYGLGWVAGDLCNGTASNACFAKSAKDGLDKQLAYGKCVAASCTTPCKK